jgi:LemA protein
MNISKPAIVTGIILGAILIFAMWLAGNYNNLVSMNEDVDNAWSKVETRYQERFDVIGNLVETVKSSQHQEVAVIKEIADGRKTYAAAQKSGDENAQAEAATKIETNVAALPKLLQEQYPELTSNQNVQMLMKKLESTEGGIADVRNTYNDTVTNYNKGVLHLPGALFANMFGFKERQQFKAQVEAAQAPKVDFSDEK